MIIEDDIHLATTIIEYLDIENIESDFCSDGLTALNVVKKERFDVIVLDINLPRMNGLEVCKSLRAEGIDTPIIMLTARGQLNDKLLGFEAGADDYLIKPFAMEELVARLNALSGRKSSQTKLIEIGCLALDKKAKTIVANEQPLSVTPTGFKILEKLMQSSPEVVSKNEIIEFVWQGEDVETNNLKVHIHKLRKELVQAGCNVKIETMGTHGYAIREDSENSN